ncbi:GntR family transcriptional regulator [Rhodococcus sp. IEGM 1366]|uniref:GntR family transcriptional regulator n=1 Tax=Rhodococcus sp. IEGM 1366 TaxID=3082223 RepID=UPI002953C535|nr:GntR family transcriptional regulator [Rhodococcus sp. IEGM 1366]MDV8071028.1 GntR family transcriptional regulator [Rhodococcus sp. IEGM 1366]
MYRPTSASQVTDHIRKMIFANELRAGERVPQDEIASALRVSRVPVREAVIVLDREGWVTTEVHRGAFVNGLDANTIVDHYEFLGMLYGFAARMATERGVPGEVVTLVELNTALQRAEDLDAVLATYNAMLRQLLRMARSRRMISMSRILIMNLVTGNYFAEVPGVVDIHRGGMNLVTQAVEAGDGEAAEAGYRTMARAAAAKVVDLLVARGQISFTVRGEA